MLIKQVIEKLPIRSAYLKMLLGAAIAALIVSLGSVVIAEWLRLSLSPAIPAIFAAICAATYATHVQQRS